MHEISITELQNLKIGQAENIFSPARNSAALSSLGRQEK